MKTFDIIVIGAGAGTKIASPAAKLGKKVALIEKGPLGGTCLNRGCIPSKMLIHAADVMLEIKEAKRFNIQGAEEGIEINWRQHIKEVAAEIDAEAASIEPYYDTLSSLTVYNEEAHFIEDKVIQVGNEQITAEQIFIVAGGRPAVPPIPGLAETPYITSKEALRLEQQPEKLIVIGGGYIGCELAHFYGGMGTQIDMLVRGDRLLRAEDTEIASEFARVFSDQYNVHFNHKTKSVSYADGQFTVEVDADGELKTFTANQLLVATGRVPNTDTLKLAENTNIKLSKKGYIDVNEYFETNVEGIYAYGDIAGKYFFRHSANYEGQQLFNNLFGNDKDAPQPMNYHGMPHAVFSYPQVAGVGATEEELKAEGVDYVVGNRPYIRSGMGMALRSDHGFVKILADRKTKEILGAHAVGREASTLIHELVFAVRHHHTTDDILNTIHIHPALSELIPKAVQEIDWQA